MDAACTAHPDVFDAATERGQARSARQHAIMICQTCPALGPFRKWLDGLKPEERPYGVVAGVIIRSTRPR